MYAEVAEEKVNGGQGLQALKGIATLNRENILSQGYHPLPSGRGFKPFLRGGAKGAEVAQKTGIKITQPL
jgi:hypothetical protein